MIARDIKLYHGFDETLSLHLTLDEKQETIIKVAELKKHIEKGKLLDFQIKPYRKKRSLDANAMVWVLADKIAEVIGNTKEFVYQQAIKQVGQFEIMPLRNEAVERWVTVWKSKGIGWHCEIMGDSKHEGYKNTINYYGSSVYDAREISVLIDELIHQAKELGLETITPREKEELINKWENRN